MSPKVIATGPDGCPQTYEYDPKNPLGAGHTGIVYRGWAESNPSELVAIKESRSADTTDMDREMEIVELLYAPNEPGGNAVPWAARGRSADGVSATPYIVMELIGGETQLSQRLAALGDAKLRENSQTTVDLLLKEQHATTAAILYARLLVRMGRLGIISRGDRKATDFRLLGGNNGAPARLVVLDWNRAEVIDISKLKEANRGEMLIKQRERDLEQGKLADIQIFARWWAEFVLGHSIVDTLRKLETDEDSGWIRLSRGYREILLAAEAAGNPRGFQKAEELFNALNRHGNNLGKNRAALLGELNEMSRATTASPQHMWWLIDLAARRGALDDELADFRRAAEQLGNEALARAKRMLATLKAEELGKRDWTSAKSKLSDARGQLGPIIPETAAAHLLLLRWEVAASAADAAGSRADRMEQMQWSGDMWRVSDAMELLDVDAQAGPASRQLLDTMKAQFRYHAAGLAPLDLELKLRSMLGRADQGDAVALYRELEGLHPDYATAVRAALPTLDTLLTADARARATADDAESINAKWAAAYRAVFARFAEDVMSGALPPSDLESARKLGREAAGETRTLYDNLWRDLYDARFRLQQAGATVDPDQNRAAMWLDGVLARMLRLRADEAAALLVAPPQRGLPSEFDARAVRDKCFERWLGRLRRKETGNGPLWPVELDTAAKLAETIRANGDHAFQTDAVGVQTALEQMKGDLTDLQSRLGVDRYRNDADWPGFLQHVTNAPGEEIDAALRAAGEKRLEVWQPAPVAEDARDPGYAERILEGYRVRTLLSLRTAAMLPRRVREYSEQLNIFAAKLEASSAHADGVLASLRDVEVYPARMDTLSELLRQMNGVLAGIRDAERESKEIQGRANETISTMARDQEGLEKWNDSLTQLVTNIDTVTKKAQSAFGNSPLAEIWLAHSLSQAAALNFNAALDSISHARTLNPENEAIKSSATLLAESVTDLSKLADGGNGRNIKWEALQRLRRVIDAGDAGKSRAELSELKRLFPGWSSNLILSKLVEQAEGLSPTSIAYIVDPDPADPDPADPLPVGSDPVSPPSRITFPPPGLDTTPAPSKRNVTHQEFNEARNAWGNALKNPSTVHDSEKVRKAVADTEKLLLHEMSKDQINGLLVEVERALGYTQENSKLFLDHNNNFGHLYILKLKLARYSASEVYHV